MPPLKRAYISNSLMKIMPIIKVLPDLPEESNDTPKLFTNIDSEDYEFTWVGDTHYIYDAEGKIIDTRIDKTNYVIKAGETKTFPKYLVNYAATHLTNKILKREAFAKITDEKARSMGIVNWKNEEKAKELSAKMVVANFPQTEEIKEVQNEPVQIEDAQSSATIQKPAQEPVKCDICGKMVKSKFGLMAHKRLAHR